MIDLRECEKSRYFAPDNRTESKAAQTTLHCFYPWSSIGVNQEKKKRERVRKIKSLQFMFEQDKRFIQLKGTWMFLLSSTLDTLKWSFKIQTLIANT